MNIPPEIPGVSERSGIDEAVRLRVIEDGRESRVGIPYPGLYLSRLGKVSVCSSRLELGIWNTYSSGFGLEVCDTGSEFGVEPVDDGFLEGLGGCCLGEHL